MISCRRWQCERPRPAFCARSGELLVVRAWLLSGTGDAGRARIAVRWCEKLRLASTRIPAVAGTPCGFGRARFSAVRRAFYC